MSTDLITLEHETDFERAGKYWDAFWHGEIIDRPCTSIWAKKEPEANEPVNLLAVTGADFTSAFELWDKYLKSHAFLGEAMPAFRPGFGPDQMAGFLGAPIIVSDGSSITSWSEKIVEDWKSFLPLKINDDNICWQRMKEYHAAAEEYYKGKCLLGNIDLHSNIDTLEGLRGAQNLLFDMIDKPETLLEAMSQVRRIFREVYETFYAYGNKERLGTTSGLHMYSRGKHGPIQADFICLLSPDMFRRFVLPAIVEEAQYLDHSCFHLDGPDALVHLDDILAIKEIHAVQWVSGAGARHQLEWPEVLHKIQAAGKAVPLYGTVEQIKAIHGQYKPELVQYDIQADSVEEGAKFMDWLVKNT